MSQSYELTTIADIFAKVPSDRIRDCCDELGKLMAMTKATLEAAQHFAKVQGREFAIETLIAAGGIKFPITWIDDGKGELTTIFTESESGEAYAEIQIRKEQASK